MCEMSEMILRVAQIISNNDEYCLCTKVPCRGDMIDCDCCHAAYKIIAAMREPTDAICNNIGLAIAADLPSDAIWRNAIDEALR